MTNYNTSYLITDKNGTKRTIKSLIGSQVRRRRTEGHWKRKVLSKESIKSGTYWIGVRKLAALMNFQLKKLSEIV
jgi:hypothetical protein